MSRQNFGEKNGMCRHSDLTVQLVRSVYRRGAFGYKKIAKLTGIPESSIRQWITEVTRAQPAEGGA